MIWIIAAAIVNTLWTLWCVQLLPARVATHFGLGGQPDGWMSRKGFALFSIFFPLAMAAFMMFVARTGPGMEAPMQHLAAGLILFFSGISWCVVRSNRRAPARMDYPSLLLSVAVLLVFVSFSVGDFAKLGKLSHPATNATHS
jgi:hypothetical protein